MGENICVYFYFLKMEWKVPGDKHANSGGATRLQIDLNFGINCTFVVFNFD